MRVLTKRQKIALRHLATANSGYASALHKKLAQQLEARGLVYFTGATYRQSAWGKEFGPRLHVVALTEVGRAFVVSVGLAP